MNRLIMIQIERIADRWCSFTHRLKGDLPQRLIKGITWSVLGGGISSVSSLVSMILVARILGSEKFGALSLIQSTLAACIIFAGPVIGLTATKYIAEFRNSNSILTEKILGLTYISSYLISGMLTLIMVIAAQYLATNLFQATSLASLIRISAVGLFFLSLNGAQIGILAGIEAFGSIAFINFVKGVTTFPLMWFGTKYFGLNGAIISMVVSAFIAFICSDYILRRELNKRNIKPNYQRIFSNVKLLLSFSLPAFLTSGIVLITLWLGNVMLVRQVNGFSELGIFNAANQWRLAILFLPGMMVQPFLPILSNLAGTNQYYSFMKVLRFNVLIATIATLIPSIGVLLFTKFIIATYGATFVNGILTMEVIVLSVLVAAPTLGIIQAMNALGRLWASAGIHLIWAVVFLFSLRLTISQGSQGLAFAYLISYVVQSVLFICYLNFAIFRNHNI